MSNLLDKIFKPTARGKIWLVFISIVILVFIAGMIDGGNYYNKGVDWLSEKTNNYIKLPHTKEIGFKLGLDLQGGTHLVYDADVSGISYKDRDSAIEGVRDVIERRVNAFGVSEPIVQTNKTSSGDYRVIVELAGIKDVNEAIKMIGETPLLEFKEKGAGNKELTPEQQQQLTEYNDKALARAEEVLGKLLSGGDFSALAKEYSEDQETKDSGGDLGWITEADNYEIASIAATLKKGEITKDLVTTSNGYEIVYLEDKREKTNPFSGEPDKEVLASHLLICYEGAQGCESGLSKEEAYNKIYELKKQATPDNFSDLVKENSTEPGASETGGELGWFGGGTMVKPFEDTVFNQEVGTISDIIETDFGYHLIYKKAERNVIEYKVKHIFINTMTDKDIIGEDYNWKNTELTGKNLKRASVHFNPNDGSPEVSLEFDSEGANMFADITERNIGNQVAIFLDNYLISAPIVNEKITGGKAVISGNFNIKEAKLLAQRLNAGALPVPISLVSQKTVGASLGEHSIQASLKASILGLILIAIFMIVVYRLYGILATISLAAYGIFVLAIFKIIPVTLTLSGLAGFILSIGMAVDANVLIFERIKEELKKAIPLENAIDEGFKKAWPSIRDGNFSTIITCIILIVFTTGVVKGFAITLILGILVSMFSAIVITKNLLMLFADSYFKKFKWIWGIKKNKN